jgi:hypothetical protein
MPTAQIMKIRRVSYEYIGKDEDIDLFFKAAIRDYLKSGSIAKAGRSTFVGCVENLINKGNTAKLNSFA